MICAAGQRRSRGFSLVEVMLALALFGLAVTTFAASYINVISAMAVIQVDQAYEQDMSLIRRLAFTKETFEELEEGGEIMTGSHGQVVWRAEHESTFLADLFKVTLTVELPDRESGELREIEEVHYLTRPTWSDPTERAELRAETRDRLLAKQTGLE